MAADKKGENGMDLEVRKLIPVFVHHEGNASYVKDCIVQAQKYNERVILFGDKTNREMGSEWYLSLIHI